MWPHILIICYVYSFLAHVFYIKQSLKIYWGHRLLHQKMVFFVTIATATWVELAGGEPTYSNVLNSKFSKHWRNFVIVHHSFSCVGIQVTLEILIG